MDSVKQAAAQSRVCVIVPVLRDSDTLERLLADLESQTRQPDSIIVVSGCHDPRLSQVLSGRQLQLIETRASRGLQLDTGARAADAEILWFIHADARLPRNACESIVMAVAAGAAGGCLRFRLQGRASPFRRLFQWLVRLRIACGGMAYGDQALFCTRDAYRCAGGFPHWPLFEEVPLVRHLQRARRFAVLDTPVYVATRRWERDGWLRRSLHNRWLALRHMAGTPAAELAAAYGGSGAEESKTSGHSNATETHG